MDGGTRRAQRDDGRRARRDGVGADDAVPVVAASDRGLDLMGARSTFLRLALALAVLAAMVAAAQPVAPRAGATAGTAASPASRDAALRDAVRGAVARQFGVRVEDVG